MIFFFLEIREKSNVQSSEKRHTMLCSFLQVTVSYEIVHRHGIS